MVSNNFLVLVLVIVANGELYIDNPPTAVMLRTLLELALARHTSDAWRLRIVVLKPTCVAENIPDALQRQDSPISFLNAF